MNCRLIVLNVVILLTLVGICQAQKNQKGKMQLGERTCSYKTGHKEGADAYSSGNNKSEEKPTNWIDYICGPIIKYSPADIILPHTSLPETFESWKSFKKEMEEKYGTSIGIVLIDQHQQILDGPGSHEGRNLFWWNLTVKQKLWDCGKLIFKARGSSQDGDPPHGITPFVGTKLNLDWAAYETDSIYVANLYIEQYLCDEKLLIAVGKITFPAYFDENKVAGWDFFSHSLARNQMFTHKYHTIGALARYDVSDKLYVQAGITDAQGIRSETGLNTTFDSPDYFITMGEVGIKTQNNKGLEGNYRFNIWYDPQPLTRHDGGDSERDTLGFGLNFDQMLTEKAGAFFRYGWDDGRVRTFSNYWSLGGTYKGLISSRGDDILGFGIGQGITHQDYRNANNATHTETIFEAYYKIKIADWCSLTPDIQILLNPGTNRSNDTAIIPGVRVQMVF